MTPEILRRIATTYWGSSDAADYSTWEGKPLAAKKIQDRAYVKESLVLCDALWQTWSKHFESHKRSGITQSNPCRRHWASVAGRRIKWSRERNFNLNRAILMRDSWGGRKGDKLVDFLYEEPLEIIRYTNRDCLVPGQDGAATSRKGTVIEREEFEKGKTEYYQFRRWDT